MKRNNLKKFEKAICKMSITAFIFGLASARTKTLVGGRTHHMCCENQFSNKPKLSVDCCQFFWAGLATCFYLYALANS
jgi:hypothetical protein